MLLCTSKLRTILSLFLFSTVAIFVYLLYFPVASRRYGIRKSGHDYCVEHSGTFVSPPLGELVDTFDRREQRVASCRLGDESRLPS